VICPPIAWLSRSAVGVLRRLESPHSLAVNAFGPLGVCVRRVRPLLAPDFATLEPDLGPTPNVVEALSRLIGEAAVACLADVPRLCDG
jgi:hypothetical protein